MSDQILRLPETLRPVLSRPLGKLLKDELALKEILKKRPVKLISVGDVITSALLKIGVVPDLAVVDLRVMRAPAPREVAKSIEDWNVREVRVGNPPGNLTPELMNALKIPAPAKIIVSGEEDLAVIPAVLHSPLGAAVVYGQPREGVVVVEVTEETKRKFSEFLQRFE